MTGSAVTKVNVIIADIEFDEPEEEYFQKILIKPSAMHSAF